MLWPSKATLIVVSRIRVGCRPNQRQMSSNSSAHPELVEGRQSGNKGIVQKQWFDRLTMSGF